MNSKDLIRSTKPVSEAAQAGPPGGGHPPRPGARPPGGRPQGQGRPFSPEETAEFEEMERHAGGRHSMRPRGPFSPQEVSMIKDLLLLVCTEVMGNDFDGKIARKMMKGEVPAPGELQHIVDEVRRIPDLPESHQQLMQKLVDHINRGGQPAEELPPGAPAAPPAGDAPPPADDDLPPP